MAHPTTPLLVYPVVLITWPAGLRATHPGEAGCEKAESPLVPGGDSQGFLTLSSAQAQLPTLEALPSTRTSGVSQCKTPACSLKR